MPEQNCFFFQKTILWNTRTPKRLFPSIPPWLLIALSHVLCYLYAMLHICYQMQDVIITPSWCAWGPTGPKEDNTRQSKFNITGQRGIPWRW